jgi:hypothetical protein
MKKTFFFLLPLIVVTLIRCKNWDFNGDPPKEYPPQGRVLEYGTEKPIPDATIYQSECDGEILGNIYCWTIDSTTTDAQGYFAFTIPGGLAVSAKASGYFPSDLQPILSAGATPADIVLSPHAWLKVSLNNTSGAWQITAPGAASTDTQRSLMLEQGADSTITIFRRGNKDYKYIFSILPVPNAPPLKELDSVFVLHNGTRIYPTVDIASTWFSIYLPGHDTTDITIIY